LCVEYFSRWSENGLVFVMWTIEQARAAKYSRSKGLLLFSPIAE